MCKFTSWQCYRHAVTPEMFINQLKFFVFSWDFINRLHFLWNGKKANILMLITELSSHSWMMDIYSMSEHSDSTSEHYCLIILKKKKSKRVLPSVGLDQTQAPSELKPETNFCDNIQFSQKLWGQLSECLSSLMTTELLMSQQKVKNGLWANVNWNTCHPSQSWDIHSEWKSSSTALERELLARLVVSWWRF